MPRRSEIILSETAEAYGLTVADIKGPKRKRKHVAARRYAIARLRALHFDFLTIAKVLNRHHTTIHHHVFKAKRHCQFVPFRRVG